MDERDLDKRDTDRRDTDRRETGRHDLAALLDRLCERPFADREGEEAAPAGRRLAAALTDAAATRQGSGRLEEEGLAALAAILSGTATEAQARAFREAAIASAAVRAEAQSALAFIEAVDASPHAAPAHLLEEVLSAGSSPVRGERRIGVLAAAASAAAPVAAEVAAPLPPPWRFRRAAAAAVFVVMALGFGLSGARLWQLGPATESAPVVPVSTSPVVNMPAGELGRAAPPALDITPSDIAPRIAPIVPQAAPKRPPAPAQASAQASGDPCGPAGGLAKAATASETRARKPASGPKMAVASAPSRDCADVDRAVRAGPARSEPAAALSNRSFDRTLSMPSVTPASPFGAPASPLEAPASPPGAPASPPAAAFAPER